MKIINSIKNDSISMSQQTNPQSSLVNKIKEIISHLLNFIRNNTSCMDQSKIAISKQVNQPMNLSHEILRVLEEAKSSTEDKSDLNFVTFLFKEPVYDVPTNNKRVLDESIYDIPSNKPVLDEPIYEEIDESHYWVQDKKIINDIPPPLPPRNW